MRIEFLGADHEVTGSCHYVSVGDKHFLVDCGMEQGADTYENQDIPVNASDIDYVFVTHAHIDHSGLLPLLYAHGFRGEIYAHEATTMLCDIMLRDSAHIQESEAEWHNRRAKRSGGNEITPLYEMNDAVGVMKHFHSLHYNEKVDICDEISVRLIDAGHLLGSASVELWLRENGIEKKIVFSGDIGNGKNKPLIKHFESPEGADYVVMESTYGDREHEDIGSFETRLADILQRTLDRGGNLVIPAFSVGRTQEMLYFLRHIKEEGLIHGEHADFDVYMDSPLAVEATNVFKKNVSECFDEEASKLVASGKNPIGFAGLRIAVTSDESKLINFDMKPKVIISASGMCEAGRIRHHLKHNLWRPESTIIFVGFQVPGTLGHTLLNGAKEVRLFGETVAVEADIENMPGISGHADQKHLLKWLDGMKEKPDKVFVVHGNDEVVEIFAKKLRDDRDLDAYAPYSGDSFDLITGERIKEGSRSPKITVKKSDGRVASNVFMRLVAAGQRLCRVIDRCEGMANKDLGKFADQVNSLCDKWER